MCVAKIVVLMSGGVDSSIVAAMLKEDGHDVTGLFVDYGQLTASAEEIAVRDVCKHLGINYYKITMSLRPIVRSSLLGNGTDPYIPGRNAFLISLGTAYAKMIGYETVALGAREDSGYPDQSARFIHAMCGTIGSAYGIDVISPIIWLSKKKLIEFAKRTGFPLDITYSCWIRNIPCGECKKCLDRKKLGI